ncbi:GAF domain-containing sensor histidine kinase [Mucilaginibacter sp. BJC16-A38]|uniref:sensor histidine kinase n=1 Tax=Mucilaginibacter phenanthrenivorans TaxID=1234842 RepID=UPI002157A322|nr:GAF domain-containing sensor histidine kinase [Mucilaginibacter phenanthrenivorans]MCR8560088.1 GAF domain-containing sensor histidine kinase [Mucilaginibacter phenanthrenivorans]
MLTIPLPENEVERLAALQSYNIFDTAEEKDFDAIASLASAICGVPIALITFIDEKRQWFKSHHGTDFTENVREFSFCTHVIASGDDIMIVEDAALDERFVDNPMVTGPTSVTFYAGVPLVNEDGFALGTLCVIDQEMQTLTHTQSEALKTLGRQVVDKLELRRKVAYLEKANQDLLNSNVLIQKFASMAAHDIKNPLSSILLTSQALKIRQEKLQDEGCLRLVNLNITATKNLLELVEEMLAYSKSPSLLLAKKQEFNLNSLIQKVISMLAVPENVEVILPEEKQMIYFSMIAFEQILINLLSNAIRYNNKEKCIINIRFNQDDDFYRLEVEDNGMGIPEQYHDKIFGNNFTLKITDRYNKKGSGIGLSTIKDLLNVLNGNIYVKSVPGEGATFFISIKK